MSHKFLFHLVLGLLTTHALAAKAASDLGEDDFRTRVNEQIGLLDSVVVQLDVDLTPARPLAVDLPLRGELHQLLLAPHSVRAASYQVLAQRADGSYEEIEPGPVRTLRGVVSGFVGSVAAGSMTDEGLEARIALPDGEVYWLEPVAGRVADATLNDYVLYRSDDVIQPEGYCGVTDEMLMQAEEWRLNQERGGAPEGGTLCVADLACDADVEYFNRFGSVGNVETQINNIINAVNTQYESEVGITHVITAIVVRTAEPDPYSSTSASTLLNQFRNEWQANQGGIVRDLAQLFTDKNLDGGTIGIAWLSSVCTSNRYSVVEHISSFSCRTDLSAHEMGHNWGAGHCNCSGFTMNPSLTCANTFATSSRNAIIAFRDTRNCIDCNTVDPPALSVVAVAGTGVDLATADVRIQTDTDDWWTTGGVSNLAAGLAPLEPGVALYVQLDPNSGDALMSNVGGGGNPGNPATFVSLPRGQFDTQRFGANGEASVVGAYEPTGPTATLNTTEVNIGYIQFPPSPDGADVPRDGFVARVTIDISGSQYAGRPVVVSSGGAPQGSPVLLGEFRVAAASSEFTSPLTTRTFGFYTSAPPLPNPVIEVFEVEGTGANLATADVHVSTHPTDWWTTGGVTNQAAGLAPLAAGVEIFFQSDPNTGDAVMTNVGGGGNPGNAATFVSLPRDQFANQRFGANGAASVVGAYDPTGPAATLNAATVNIGFIQFPPSTDGSDVPEQGFVTRVTIDLSNSIYASQPVELSSDGTEPDGFPVLLGEFRIAAASREFTSPLTELTFGFYTIEPSECPGDLDGDGDRDLTDLSVLLSNFGIGTGAQPEDGDMNGDGDVDLTDLSTFLSVFALPCP